MSFLDTFFNVKAWYKYWNLFIIFESNNFSVMNELRLLGWKKTADRLTIKNMGQVMYNQAFTTRDAKCQVATTSVKIKPWKYGGSLDLAVLDNS